ncbi:MAG: TIGR04149 family rSAM-modified RiPP [Macellibacteroides fermentans]|uniref:TIGR04149 family rSAM-modified RiPP n=1 Tax=Macellibacteroides fermentans TaxID=879969 RepID=UPI003AC439D4
MKTLGKLKLNQFRKAELEKREMNILKGGCSCKCACSGGDGALNTKDNTGSSSAVAY